MISILSVNNIYVKTIKHKIYIGNVMPLIYCLATYMDDLHYSS